jgi:hypothetical protein
MRAAAITVMCLSLLASAGANPARATGDRPSDKPSENCRRLPEGKRILQLELRPGTDVVDFIGWMRMITCNQYLFEDRDVRGKKVTVKPDGLMTLEDARQLFRDALATVGLAVSPVDRGGDRPGTFRIVRAADR